MVVVGDREEVLFAEGESGIGESDMVSEVGGPAWSYEATTGRYC